MEKYELHEYKSKLNYNLSQLELDYYQHFILSKIFNKFNTIYFKGGTCLQKCYGIKRFSEDLDFNYTDININEIISFIEKIFGTKISNKYETKFGISFSISFKGILFTGTEQSKCKISFDFRKNDVYEKALKRIIKPVYKDLSNYFLIALSANEILAEKVRAIITRYKARDVYDLNELLSDDISVDKKLIGLKLNSYDISFDLNVFKDKLEEKRSIYDSEMRSLTSIYDDFDKVKNNILEKFKILT